MTILDLLKKGALTKNASGSTATATLATLATQEPEPRPTVATIAKIAVATASDPDQERHRHWTVQRSEGHPLEVIFEPAIVREAVLMMYPTAVSLQPICDELDGSS